MANDTPAATTAKLSSGSKNIKSNKVITSLATDEETLHKIKGIAYWDKITVTEIINTALKEYIKAYESSKGVIKLVQQ